MRVSEAFFKIIRLSCPIIYQTKPWSFNENKSWSWKYKQTPKSPTAWISLLFPYQNVLPSSPLLWEITLVSEQKGTLFLMTTLKQVVYTLQCLGKSIISLITLSSLEILPPLLKKKKRARKNYTGNYTERIIQESGKGEDHVPESKLSPQKGLTHYRGCWIWHGVIQMPPRHLSILYYLEHSLCDSELDSAGKWKEAQILISVHGKSLCLSHNIRPAHE